MRIIECRSAGRLRSRHAFIFRETLRHTRESEERERCLPDIIINAPGRVRTSGGFTVDNEPSRRRRVLHSDQAGRLEKSQPTNDRWSRLSTTERKGIYRGERGPTDERSLEHNKQSVGIIRLAVKIYVGRRCDVRTMTIKEV